MSKLLIVPAAVVLFYVVAITYLASVGTFGQLSCILLSALAANRALSMWLNTYQDLFNTYDNDRRRAAVRRRALRRR